MRNFMLFMLLASSSVTTFAQTTPAEPATVLSAAETKAKEANEKFTLPKNFDPMSLQKQFDVNLLKEKLAGDKAKALAPVSGSRLQALQRKTGKQLRRVGEPVDTVQYFAAAQSYYTNRSFQADGGEVLSYNIGVAVDGNKVTLTNFFSLYDPNSYSPAHDYPIEGTYDPEKKTITIPTKTNFAEATICGDFWGSYPAVLMSGTLSPEGKLSPSNELVLKVEGDFDRITTDQAVCAFMYTPDGSQSYGVQEAFKKIYIQKPSAGAKLVLMNDAVNVGETFPDYPISKTFTIANLGNDATDFAIDTESDEDAFTPDPTAGNIAGQSLQNITVNFKGPKVGNYEGISTIEWEGEDAEAMMVQYSGSVIDYPDYSVAVKNGDFTITTDIDYPFVVDKLADGTEVAASHTGGIGNATSKLYVKFTVPEGKLGTFSWKGVSNNEAQWYSNAGGVFVDDEKFSVFSGVNEDISDRIELAPGEHTVRFQYDSYYYSGVDANRLYVYDINLDLADLPADAAVLSTPAIDLGEFIVEKDAPATGTGTISILNKGKNPLKVNSVTLSGDGASVFSVDKNVSAVATLKSLDIPVTMEADKAGDYQAKATVETSAGTFTADLKALVRDMPDFQSIVKEGDFTFTTTPAHPWIVENGMAYNASAKKPDYEPTTASFTANFTVPEGKLGILSWDGEIDCKAPADPTNWYTSDYGQIEIGHPMNTGSHDVPGGKSDAGSNAIFGNDEFWAPYLQCIPGEHHVTFRYIQVGDTICSGEDRMTVKNLSLRLIDFSDYHAELESNTAKFDSTFVGNNRYTTAKVTLKNLGSKALKVLDIPQAGAFYGIVPTDSAQFSKSLDVILWFYPSAPGEYKDSLIIKTNAGDFKVGCEGVAKDDAGYLLVGDFEDDAQGWSIYDADKDGESWNLGYNLFGGDYPEYCHSGKEILGSASYSYYNGDITPDNWTFSPMVAIPEDGAMLTWYAAEQSKKRAGDYYSVYVATQEEIADPSNLGNLTPVFSETLDSTKVDTWSYNKIDLKPYAGKTVTVAFRHHNCTGCFLMKLDDVFIWTMDKWNNSATGINTVSTSDGNKDKAVLRQEYFNLAGKRLSAPAQGVTIVRTVYADGTCTTSKTIRK